MSVEETKPVSWYPSRIVPALVVIAIGVFFLLGNFGFDVPFFDGANWWAWFILIGAVGPLLYAMERYRNTGTADAEVLHSLLTAAAIVMVALMFILQLSWAQWWPLFMIYGGLCMLVRGPRRRRWKDGVR